VPFKANAARQHHIPRQRHRVTNWSEYDAALRQWGSLTVWFSDEAIAAWRAEPRTTRGGQPHYSALAIQTAEDFKEVLARQLRQSLPDGFTNDLALADDRPALSFRDLLPERDQGGIRSVRACVTEEQRALNPHTN
jgi:hypothetical protein